MSVSSPSRVALISSWVEVVRRPALRGPRSVSSALVGRGDYAGPCHFGPAIPGLCAEGRQAAGARHRASAGARSSALAGSGSSEGRPSEMRNYESPPAIARAMAGAAAAVPLGRQGGRLAARGVAVI